MRISDWSSDVCSSDLFRDCVLRFRWRSGGLRRLDETHGPTLTIEGRDAAGHARAWYVRLWNYASGGPEDAVIALDFSAIRSGFLLAEGEDVWADRKSTRLNSSH